MAFPAQAQETISICDRTQQVQNEILSKTPTEDECGSVLVSEMASISGLFSLKSTGISFLKEGDFDGLVGIAEINLANNKLTELPAGIFSGLPELKGIGLQTNSLKTLPSGIFLGLPKLIVLRLDFNSFSTIPRAVLSILPNLSILNLEANRIRTLAADVFRGATSLTRLQMDFNPGEPFRFTVRFSPPQLRWNFTTASVRLVLREGAPRPVTVPISATGATLSANKLSIATGGVRSDAVTVTRTPGDELFELSQGEPELGGDDDRYSGFEIVRGHSVTTTTFTHLRVKVFLEGALE